VVGPLTEVEAELLPVTSPTLWSMVTCVAPSTVH